MAQPAIEAVPAGFRAVDRLGRRGSHTDGSGARCSGRPELGVHNAGVGVYAVQTDRTTDPDTRGAR